MISVAIVEDNREYAQQFAEYIRRYEQETHTAFSVEIYSDGLQFISDYSGKTDIIFMDIVMPHMDGLDAAKRLREADKTACLIFITTMAQYAIRGYEVNALDFLVKPVGYELFAMKLEKAIASLEKDEVYPIAVANGVQKVRLKDIVYIESNKHYLYFHTKEEEYRMRGSLKDIRDFFERNKFVSANGSLLINLAYVDGMLGNEVSVNGERMLVGRQYKADFWDRLTEYMGGL